ncbi:hypothetical protein E1B28_000928 [Marasmius oreades]|uniref:Uncharacterized protein n=1 Tax=Marasmius oreades TaxID=181124 RepID=A0A9P7V2D4_9AGAR|nr:uncharacterized protein E1B28_000928 [Marasmius oreades]KAG7099053.1 hypothetical protein E1B28_000928 [Marasmius oreades]
MALTPTFQNPYHFARHRSNKWTCNICSSLTQMNPTQALGHEASLEHANNAAMDDSNWWGVPDSNWHKSWDIDAVPIVDHAPLSKEAMKDREHRYFADQVDDLIPFWLRSVKAAERGEVLKLTDFLDSLEDRDIWPPRVPNPWRFPEAQSFVGGKARSKDNWAPDQESVHDCWRGWGSHSGYKSNTSWGSDERNGFSVKGKEVRNHRMKWGPRISMENGHDFVEEIAVQKAVNDARKHEMHIFYELPTPEKIKRIQDLIRSLRGS